MTEYDIQASPIRRLYRSNLRLNPQASVNVTYFIPPSITDEQYIIQDREVGVAVQSVEILDSIANGSISVLGEGRLVVL